MGWTSRCRRTNGRFATPRERSRRARLRLTRRRGTRTSIFPVDCAAGGRRAGVRRAPCARGRGRRRARPARRGDRVRRARRRLHVHGGLSVDPQHGRLDDRRLRNRRSAPALPAQAERDGMVRELLPDRAGSGLGRGRARHPGRARRRCLRGQRREGVHLRRRRLGRLPHHGAHRRRRRGGDIVPCHRTGLRRDVVRRPGEEARLAFPADGDGPFRRLPRAGGQPDRRRGPGVPHRDGRARRRAGQYRRLLDRRRADVLRGRPPPCRRTPPVRPGDRRLPDGPVQAGRHGDGARCRAADGLARRRRARRRRAGRHAPLRDGQAARHRYRVRGVRRPRCSSTAATAIFATTGSSAIFATSGSTRYWKEPTRSCA